MVKESLKYFLSLPGKYGRRENFSMGSCPSGLDKIVETATKKAMAPQDLQPQLEKTLLAAVEEAIQKGYSMQEVTKARQIGKLLGENLRGNYQRNKKNQATFFKK